MPEEEIVENDQFTELVSAHTALIKEALKNAEELQKSQATRLFKIQMIKDFFEDEQEKYIPRVGAETVKHWKEREKLTVNYSHPVIEKKASVYEGDPVRYVDKENIKTLLEPCWNQSTFQSVDLQAEMGGYSAIKIYFENEELYYQVIPAETLFPYVNENTKELLAMDMRSKRVVYKQGKSKEILYDQVWTEFLVQEFENGQPMGEAQIHSYGCIPFVFFFCNTRDRDFSNTPAVFSTVQLNQKINVLLSDLRYIIRHQSFAILKHKNAQKDYETGQFKMPKMEIGPSTILHLPEGEDYVYEPAPGALTIASILEVVKFLVEKLFETSQIPTVTIAPSTTIASGVSLEVQWYPLENYLKKKRSSYRESEQTLATKSILVWNNLHGVPMETDFTFTIDFSEENVPTTSSEVRETDRFEIDLGVKTAVDVLMRENPDLTEEEALKQLMENLNLTKVLNEVKTSFSPAETKSIEEQVDKELAGEGE